MRAESDYQRVRALIDTGLGDRDIAPIAGVPRSTVNRWRNHARVRSAALPSRDWRPLNRTAYGYLLGLYLGDGHVQRTSKHSYCLSLYLDELYPGISRGSRSQRR